MFKTIFTRGVWGLKLISSLLFYLLVLVVNTCLYSQDRPQWNDITAGPHDIGFKVINTYDHSRGYFPKPDYTGAQSDYETSRPMQISIWYPAETDEESRRMVFGDYIELLASELGQDRVTDTGKQEAREQLRRGPLNPYYPHGVSDRDLERVLNTPIPVFKDVKHKPDLFPLVIHAGFGLVGQSVLNEYLASNGYIVVSFPVLSTHPAWYNCGEGTMEWYQAIADDIGFVYSEMKNFPSADRSKTAVIGMFAASDAEYATSCHCFVGRTISRRHPNSAII